MLLRGHFFFFLHASLSYECQGRISIGLSCSWEEIKMLFLLIFVFMFLVHIWGCCWIKPSTAIFAFFLHMCRKRAPNTSGTDVTFHWSKCRAWLAACRVVSSCGRYSYTDKHHKLHVAILSLTLSIARLGGGPWLRKVPWLFLHLYWQIDIFWSSRWALV